MSNCWNPKKSQRFHNQHEAFTQKAYDLDSLLPDRYVFVLTNLCNLKCRFCFQEKDLRENRMRLNDWINISAQLPEYSRVTFTGGEPLMFDKFDEIFRFVASRFDCNMISNGLLLNQKKIDLLLSFEKFRVLSISIDNIGNKVRDVNEKQWDRTKNMMQRFVEKRNELKSNCVLEAKTVVLDSNAKELFDIYRYCVEELYCDNHSFQFLKGSPIQHADFMFQFDDMFNKSSAPVYEYWDVIIEQLEKVRKYNIRTGKKSFLHPKVASLNSNKPISDIRYLNESDFIKENYFPCKFPWSSIHINVDGDLFPCMAIQMGNVKKTPLEEIIWGKDFINFKDIIRNEGTVEGCNRCGWLRPK
jgi:MoaA/NifB/PqqE/SkfB family radical SAM enzyme